MKKVVLYLVFVGFMGAQIMPLPVRIPSNVRFPVLSSVAPVAPTFVTAVSNVSGAYTVPVSVNISSHTGDFLYVWECDQNGYETPVSSISDGVNTYTQVPVGTQLSSYNLGCAAFTTITVSTTTLTITTGVTSGPHALPGLSVLQFRGVTGTTIGTTYSNNSTSPISLNFSAGATTGNLILVALANSNALAVFSAPTLNNSQTMTIPSGAFWAGTASATVAYVIATSAATSASANYTGGYSGDTVQAAGVFH